jgi:bacterial/archaeal transporter family protein
VGPEPRASYVWRRKELLRAHAYSHCVASVALTAASAAFHNSEMVRRTNPHGMTNWLVPALAYLVVVGALGITTKLALKTLSWQELMPWATIAYVVATAWMLAAGQTRVTSEPGTAWAIASGVLAVGGLILLYSALSSGDASKVVPVTPAYLAVTLVPSALVLSESVSPGASWACCSSSAVYWS